MRLPILLLILALALPARGFEYWNDVRHSAVLPDTTVTVRVENPSGAGVENYLLYAGSEVFETAMSPVVDGPMTLTAGAPGPSGETGYYGFRLLQSGELDLMPVKYTGGSSPVPGDLTRLVEDPAGDELFGYQNLDLVECHVSFSDTELHGSLTNVGGGFPLSQTLTFFSYLIAIADPEAADPDTVFGLIRTYEVPGTIRTALYKITGPDTGDLIDIGEISVQEFPADNTLILSCQLADLLADPYFQSWYDPADPRIGVAGFTQRITILGGADDADIAEGGTCHLREFSIAPGVNTLPVLSDALFTGDGATAAAQIDYLDADGHCPVLAEIVFDDTDTYPLYPQFTDYSGEVIYRSDEGIAPLAGDTWTDAVFRFSDNATDVVEHEESNTGVDPEVLALSMDVLPNPVTGEASVRFTVPSAGRLKATVYDVRGSLVATLVDRDMAGGPVALRWDGRDDSGREASSGIYFVRAVHGEVSVERKLVLIR